MATSHAVAFPPETHQLSFDVSDPPYATETLEGRRESFGAGTPAFVVHIKDQASWERLKHGSAYHLATAFVDGEFDVSGDLVAAVQWAHGHVAHGSSAWKAKLLLRLYPETWMQTRRQARQNIHFHYDRSNLFYEQFLDRRMIYSSAYFSTPGMSLDEAQLAKLDHICRTLDLRRGDHLLDVGCGWGALIVHAAERYGASAVGCTVSGEQFQFVQAAIDERRLTDRVVVANADYRTMAGEFDKIASIGMYEHVGRRRLQAYFTTLARLLKPHGLLLNSGVARPAVSEDDDTTLFLRRFVFPGGELPYLADVVAGAERAGLEVIDIENLRQHYARTCAEWVKRLQAHPDECLALVDAATYRTWLLYLSGAAASFNRADIELYQVLFAKRARMPAERRDPPG
jgi:cyclopropane-fatty-acyl-phospholipid synthase